MRIGLGLSLSIHRGDADFIYQLIFDGIDLSFDSQLLIFTP